MPPGPAPFQNAFTGTQDLFLLLSNHLLATKQTFDMARITGGEDPLYGAYNVVFTYMMFSSFVAALGLFYVVRPQSRLKYTPSADDSGDLPSATNNRVAQPPTNSKQDQQHTQENAYEYQRNDVAGTGK